MSFFFLTRGGDIVWVAASTKLRDLWITWSLDKLKKLISTLLQYLWPSSLAEW